MKDELSISEAAELLGVSRVAVWSWVNDGKIPARRIGLGKRSPYRIKAKDVQKVAAQLGIELTLAEILTASSG